MILVLGIVFVLASIGVGLLIASAMRQVEQEAKLAKLAKRKGTSKAHPYIAAVEAKGHKVQVIDVDTGEVFEPKEKP